MKDIAPIHSLLNYSFSSLDIDNYFGHYKAERPSCFEKRFGVQLCSHGQGAGGIASIAQNVCTLYDAREERPQSDVLITAERLGKILVCMSSGANPTQDDIVFVERVQKKFEIFHRVFTAYNSAFRKSGDVWDDLHIYGLLSIVLHLMFRLDGNFNHLNTSIKLNDLILKSDWPVPAQYAALIAFAVTLEWTFMEDALRVDDH
jgi:hypothetical protein